MTEFTPGEVLEAKQVEDSREECQVCFNEAAELGIRNKCGECSDPYSQTGDK